MTSNLGGDLSALIRARLLAAPLHKPDPRRVPLQVPSYGAEEIEEVLDSLLSGWVTMGAKVKAFEEAWAMYIGVKHAVMTNSGSSANLLALSALGTDHLRPGDTIYTPALTWATTVFPIAQAGYLPVLVDVDMETYNMSMETLDRAIVKRGGYRRVRTMPVHLLGNPCSVDISYDRPIIEDACEAHGAEVDGKRVGSFGLMGTFSFFFSHHISTIEGGMVVTNDDYLADELRCRRAFGWVRDSLPSFKPVHIKDNPNIDPRFLFAYPGYNMRPTELAGAFGLHQLPRLEGYIAIRRANMAYWNKELANWQDWLQLPVELPDTRHVSFAYAVTVKEKAPFTAKALMAHLEENGVECRPIEAGAIHLQPAMKRIKWRAAGSLENAEYIHHNAFMWGNHQGVGPEQRAHVVTVIRQFMGRY